MSKPRPQLILGFDPGLGNTGFGLIRRAGTTPRYEASGTIEVAKTGSLAQTLAEQWKCVAKLIQDYQPDCCVVEDVFVGPHPKAALHLGMAHAIVLTHVGLMQLPVFTYAPTRVKKNITANGRASKEKLASMIRLRLGIRGVMSHHATDALGLALCHFYASEFFI